MTKILDSKIPEGPIAEKWTNYKDHQKLVNPANKRRLDIIVVGKGLAGASADASLGEMGFRVFNFCIQDSPRRAHSLAAQGGINASKNYQNDGDSVYRLFYDTVKGVGNWKMPKHYRLVQRKVAIFLKRTVTTIWNAVNRHSVTWFRVTWLHVPLKNFETTVSVLTTLVWPYSLTSLKVSNVWACT